MLLILLVKYAELAVCSSELFTDGTEHVFTLHPKPFIYFYANASVQSLNSGAVLVWKPVGKLGQRLGFPP